MRVLARLATLPSGGAGVGPGTAAIGAPRGGAMIGAGSAARAKLTSSAALGARPELGAGSPRDGTRSAIRALPALATPASVPAAGPGARPGIVVG